MLVSDMVEFTENKISSDGEWYYINDPLINVAILNLYAPNNSIAKCKKYKQIELKGKQAHLQINGQKTIVSP